MYVIQVQDYFLVNMKLVIARVGDNIFVEKDFTDIKDRGEVAHMLCELEVIKQDLLEIWGALK